MKKTQNASFFVSLLVVFWVVGCGEENGTQKVHKFPKNEWHVEQKPLFEFAIEAPNQSYDLIVLLKNVSAYPYQNLYINYSLEGEETSESALIEWQLFDKKTGRPLGSGWGDGKLHRLCLISNYTFKKAGIYRVQLVHCMRRKVLGGIERVMFVIKPTRVRD